MKLLQEELKENNILWITPESENIFQNGQLEQIFALLTHIANKNKDENFGMMPQLTNVKLITGEVCEAVASANFKKGKIELIGIFLFDPTKINYKKVRSILERHLLVQFYN